MIKTHHRVGYSFAADVTEVSAALHDRGQPAFILESARRRILLFEGAVTLGRDGGCDIVINDPSVSREHAVLTVTDGQLTVADRDSKNGTRVDDQRIGDETAVSIGQRIRFGSIELLVRESVDVRGHDRDRAGLTPLQISSPSRSRCGADRRRR